MISEQQYYYLWNDYNTITLKMQVKIYEFKTKNPHYDISDQLETIETIIRLQNVFSKQYDLIRTLDSQHGNWAGEKRRLLERISQLENENKTLKEEITM